MAQSKQDELYKALQQKGYPDSLCREIAYKQMNTDYTATRMLGYLYRISDPRPEDAGNSKRSECNYPEKRIGTCAGNDQ